MELDSDPSRLQIKTVTRTSSQFSEFKDILEKAFEDDFDGETTGLPDDNDDDEKPVYVVTKENKVIAGCIVNRSRKPCLLLSYFAVHKDHRGQHNGYALLNHLQGKAFVSWEELWLYCHGDNIKARKFYERNGFEMLKQRDDPKKTCLYRWLPGQFMDLEPRNKYTVLESDDEKGSDDDDESDDEKGSDDDDESDNEVNYL